MPVFIWEFALFILWITALVFSALSLLVKLVRSVICKRRHRDQKIVLGRWSAGAAGLQLLGLVLLGAAVSQAMGYAVASTYAWMFGAIGVLGIVMIVFSVYGAVGMVKRKSSRIRKIYNGTVLFLLISTVVNIGYWNLFMFWAL